MNNNLNNPIIITGMHRSGSSILTKILIENNVFMGSYLDSNNESIFFQRLNKWIFSCIGSSWDNPRNLYDLDPKDYTIILKKINKVLNSRISNSLYFGKSNLFFNKKFLNNKFPWGWKDPSNTFTLNIWKKKFPNAKVININRNPLDVSLSLVKRQKKLKKQDSYSLLPHFISVLLPVLSINKGGILSSFNLDSIDDCLILYDKYYRNMNKNISHFDNILNINYEDFVLNSKNVLENIFDYLDLPLEKNIYKKSIKKIKKDRIYNYKNKNIIYNKDLLDNIDYKMNK